MPMGITSETTAQDQERVERVRLRRFLYCAAGWLVGLVVLPLSIAGIWYLGFLVGSIVLCVRRLGELEPRLRRPVTLILIAAGLSLTGSVVRSVLTEMNGTAPLPSIADPILIASAVFFLWAILSIVRRRNPRLGLDPLLDAGVATIAVALLQWTLVLIPQMQSDQITTAGKATNAIYGTLALAQVAAAVLALVAGSVPTTSNRLLAAGLVTAFTLDSMFTLASVGRLPEEPLLLVSAFVFVMGASGLLHPSVHQLLERPNELAIARRLSRRRISVLALALLTPPVLMLWAALNLEGLNLTFILPVTASLGLSPLVLTRLGRLVHQNEELASMETTLRSVGERLVSADSTDDVVGIITAGAEQVLRANFVEGALLLAPAGQANPPKGQELQMLEQLLSELPDGTHGVTGDLVSIESLVEGQHRTAGLIVVQREVRGVLVLTTQSTLGEEERNAVTTLCRECAIAFRAVEHTEQQVRQRSEDRFAALVDNSSDIVAVLDADARFTYVSPVVQRLLGYTAEEFLGIEIGDLVHPDDLTDASKMIEDIRFGLRESTELRMKHVDQVHRWFETVGVDLTSDPNIGGIVINAREITDRKEAEERLVLSEARFKSLVQHSTDLVVVLDPDRRIRYASPSVSTVLAQTPDEVQSRSVTDVFRDSDLDWGAVLEQSSTGVPELLEFTFQNAAQQWRTIETTITDLRSEPAVHGFVLNARDITDRKNMEQRLRYQATHDELTGLANRVHVLDDLTGMLGRNSGSTTVGAVLIGIDDFKEINDSLGHAAGDELLVSVAARVTTMLGFGDIAARVGGDEFVVVLERAHGENHITDLTEQILATIAAPHQIDGRELTVTASAGVVFDHDRTHTAEILLRNADIAMYRAKTLGKRQTVVFEPHMHTDSYDRLELRADLARAVELEQFLAHYQPVVDIETRQIVGCEALIRWQHPERGLLGPNVFIPLAEETGLIGALGEWILERACTDLVSWRSAFGKPMDDFTMSVNLSVQQLHDHDIVDTVSQILERTGLPAQRLVLEVTESTLITDTERIQATMHRLRSLGARLAVDDFGTGYSSLGYIQQFEFDVLKIDKTFVDALESHTTRRVITAVLELARQLQVRTIAEGIESELQAHLLEDLGCSYGQGYLYSRPVAADSFVELLTTNRTATTGHARL